MKEDIAELVQLCLKGIKPFLRYFTKCTFSKGEPGRCMHIIGVDVLFDQEANPWLLELNAGPSLSVIFDPDNTIKKNLNEEPPISKIDLHVKSLVVGDAVKLCQKPLSQLLTLEEFKSYTQVFSPEIEQEMVSEFGIIDTLYDLFLAVSGSRFQSALTMSKFTKVTKLFRGVTNKIINKIDVEMIYKKILQVHENMDFYAFIPAIDLLMIKTFGKNSDLNKKEQYEKIMGRFKEAKKPLF